MRRALLLLLLAVFLGRIALTWRVSNDTADESAHIRAGLGLLQFGAYGIELQHPPVARVAVAALPYWFAGLRLDAARSELWRGAWRDGDQAFYWRSLVLARAGNLVFAILLFGFVCWWSAKLYGPWAEVAAAAIVACCPNLIAHGSLATLDMAAAATTIATACFFWRANQQPGWRWCVPAAVGR